MNTAVDQPVQLAAVGDRAHAAIVRCGGVLLPLPAFPDSPYMLAGDDIVWLGGEAGIWHPRRIQMATPLAGFASTGGSKSYDGSREIPANSPTHLKAGLSRRVQVSIAGARVWRCARLPHIAPAQLSAACMFIRCNIAAIGTPAGFGALLAGDSLRFPLNLAPAKVRALAAAVQCDDAAAFETAALPLLGLGLGLTPSGDDLVGACLFARRLCGLDAAWEVAAQHLEHAASVRSNAISAALFGDLARGAAYSPLHQLAAAGDDAALIAAARALSAIGHSSGWDMLTGFMIGAAAQDAIGWKATPGVAFQPVTEPDPAVFSRFARPDQDVTP